METQYDSLYSTLSKIETKKGVGKLLREFESAMQRMDDLVDLEIKKDPQSEKIPYFLKIKSLIGQEVDAQYNKDGSKHEGLFCISADERGEFKEILLKQERKDENGETFIYTLSISTTEGSAPSILPLEENRNLVNIEKNSSGEGSFALSSLSLEENRNLVNIEKIASGEDTRTTLMIKGIPRKYTSQMLLDEINKNHQGNYDYFYLPVNKRKKYNASYAFINMVSPLEIISFYQDFHGRKWDKFDGKEVTSLVYAKTQGKDALLEDYYSRTPNLMERDPQFSPIVFSKGQEQDNIIPQKIGEEEQQK